MCLQIIGVATLIAGIIVIVKGKVAMDRSMVVRGGRARIIGGLLIAGLPASLLIAFAYGVVIGLAGREPDEQSVLATGLPLFALIGLPLIGVVLAYIWGE